MKHFLLYIVFIFSLFNLTAANAKIYQLPDDFAGEYTRGVAEQFNKGEITEFDINQLVNITLEVGQYFHDKYSIEEMADKNFIEKLRPFFPEDSDEELRQKQYLMGNLVTLYDEGKQFYDDYISSKLAPADIRVVNSYNDFDHPDEVSYVEAESGYFVKVYNFKKFLTYSKDKGEREAIAKFIRLQSKNENLLEKMEYMARQIEWKKLPFYGTVYKNPLLSERGVSPVLNGKDVKINLISRQTAIEDADELDFGIHLVTSPYSFILANNLSPELKKPQINLDKSENIADYKVFYPIPLNAGNLPEAHKYFGDFLIILKIKPADKSKDVVVRADVTLHTCDNRLDCTPESFLLEQTIKPMPDSILSNGYDNFFVQNIYALPQENSEKLKLRKIVTDNDEQGQIIRLEFNAQTTIHNFKVFLEQKDGYTKFATPLISLQDNKIYVRFTPLERDSAPDLTNAEFIVTASLNNRYAIRETVKASAASNFDPQTEGMNFALIFMAFLGGLLLNFMPCVFPVLSLKIMTFSYAQTSQRQKIKSDIKATIAGIFCGFSIIILMLTAAKKMGYSLGWGMQFQNMSFMVAITFIIAAFIVILPQLSSDILSKFSTKDNHHKTNLLIGTLIVLLATPCTGPYLATAIGFALTGSYKDIIVMLYMVALGLASPYFIALFLKHPETLFPKPGPWMRKLQIFTNIMLYLTILWFFSLILGQTDWQFVFKFVALILLFMFFFWIYHRFITYLNNLYNVYTASPSDGIIYEKYSPRFLQKVRTGSHLIIGGIFITMVWLSVHMAQKSYQLNYDRNMSVRQTIIDENKIKEKIAQGHSVLLEVNADWCMTCHFNDNLIFNKHNLERWQKIYNLDFMQIDWTAYNRNTLDFMSRYGRKGLPFYILYTPLIREGMVLPEIFYVHDFEEILARSITR